MDEVPERIKNNDMDQCFHSASALDCRSLNPSLHP